MTVWDKPDSEELLPYFMQETTGFFRAMILYFGLPALTTCMLLYYHRVSFSLIFLWYGHTLNSIFTSQNLFYLIHLVPALAARFIYGRRFTVKTAFMAALLLDLLALPITYPVRSLLTPAIRKNIFLFASLPPLLMAFFTLRIYRLRIAGGIVIVVFLGMLSWKLL
jgi:hypothetical protein